MRRRIYDHGRAVARRFRWGSRRGEGGLMPHVHSAAAGHRDRVIVVCLLTLTVFAIEIVGGVLSNSLALVADAGHVFTDVFGIGLVLAAIWLAGRPGTSERRIGFLRLAIFAPGGHAL